MKTWPELSGDIIVAEARTWIGTPFHHGGRVKGAGVDCAGLLAGVWLALGVPVRDELGYACGDHFVRMEDVLERHALRLRDDAPLSPGNILIFRSNSMPQHASIFTGDGTMIHAWDIPAVGRVAETALDRFWLGHLASAWRYRGMS